MAKITAPLLGFDAEGSIADLLTYARWKGRTYVKRHRAPVNQQTFAQVEARDTLAAANSIWKTAPALFKTTWDRSADRKPRTGYNAWIGRYIEDNLNQANLVNLVMAPKVLGGLGPANIGLVPASQSIVVNFALGTTPIGWFLQATLAATIINQNPANIVFPAVTAGEEASPPGPVTLTGLLPGVGYVATGWLRWLLPAGTVAYGQSFPMQGTVPLP